MIAPSSVEATSQGRRVLIAPVGIERVVGFLGGLVYRGSTCLKSGAAKIANSPDQRFTLRNGALVMRQHPRGKIEASIRLDICLKQ
jgi:hypothetical protein